MRAWLLLQQTAHRLGRAVVAVSSWRAQARHPRLAVLKSAKGVNGGPAAAMTMKARRRPVSTCVRFAVAPSLVDALGAWLGEHFVSNEDVLPPLTAYETEPGNEDGAAHYR
jgi:hypothetical protein